MRRFILAFSFCFTASAQIVSMGYSQPGNGATVAGTYVGVPQNHQYGAVSCTIGTPDTVKFNRDGGAYTVCRPITGIAQALIYPAGNVSNANWAAGVATYTDTAHGLASGALVTVTGVAPSGYNVVACYVTVIDANRFSCPAGTSPGTYVNGGAATASDGLTITWAATTGHAAGAIWPIVVTANGTAAATSTIAAGAGARPSNVQEVLRRTIWASDYVGPSVVEQTRAAIAGLGPNGGTVRMQPGSYSLSAVASWPPAPDGVARHAAIIIPSNVTVDCGGAYLTASGNTSTDGMWQVFANQHATVASGGDVHVAVLNCNINALDSGISNVFTNAIAFEDCDQCEAAGNSIFGTVDRLIHVRNVTRARVHDNILLLNTTNSTNGNSAFGATFNGVTFSPDVAAGDLYDNQMYEVGVPGGRASMVVLAQSGWKVHGNILDAWHYYSHSGFINLMEIGLDELGNFGTYTIEDNDLWGQYVAPVAMSAGSIKGNRFYHSNLSLTAAGDNAASFSYGLNVSANEFRWSSITLTQQSGDNGWSSAAIVGNWMWDGCISSSQANGHTHPLNSVIAGNHIFNCPQVGINSVGGADLITENWIYNPGQANYANSSNIGIELNGLRGVPLAVTGNHIIDDQSNYSSASTSPANTICSTPSAVSSSCIPAISAASWTGGVIIYTDTAHGLSNGQWVSISGASPTGYNLGCNVRVVNANRFTCPSANNPGSYVSGGGVASLWVLLQQNGSTAAWGSWTNRTLYISTAPGNQYIKGFDHTGQRLQLDNGGAYIPSGTSYTLARTAYTGIEIDGSGLSVNLFANNDFQTPAGAGFISGNVLKCSASATFLNYFGNRTVSASAHQAGCALDPFVDSMPNGINTTDVNARGNVTVGTSLTVTNSEQFLNLKGTGTVPACITPDGHLQRGGC